jgi:hypothetical protein
VIARRVVVALGAAALLSGHASAADLTPLPAIVHVHSDLSTGQFSLEELAAMAEKQRIGALLVTENYLNRVDYGLPPFRALTRVSEESPSVRPRLGHYLDRVDAARAARPNVLLIPGVEVMPHYRWGGSPFAFEVTVTNTQKNLLVFGLNDRATLSALPVIGNGAGGEYTPQSGLDALPAVLLVPGVALVIIKRQRRRRSGQAVIVVARRHWFAGLVLCALAVAALVRGWPFKEMPYSAYEDYGTEPYQMLIDYVEQAGGAAVWSFPEARDTGAQMVGPVRVSWSTEPYGDDLLRTFRYTAFGAIYEEQTQLERPGGGWDRLLAQYAAGERSRPAWGLGEAGFHDGAAGKKFGRVQTVFLVRERTETGVLEALRQGHLYALMRTAQTALVLEQFSASSDGVTAVSGETLRPPPGETIDVVVALDAVGQPATDLRLALVKNGVIVDNWTGVTPFRVSHREVWDGKPVVFRVEARGANGRLLSNPIFVRPS